MGMLYSNIEELEAFLNEEVKENLEITPQAWQETFSDFLSRSLGDPSEVKLLHSSPRTGSFFFRLPRASFILRVPERWHWEFFMEFSEREGGRGLKSEFRSFFLTGSKSGVFPPGWSEYWRELSQEWPESVRVDHYFLSGKYHPALEELFRAYLASNPFYHQDPELFFEDWERHLEKKSHPYSEAIRGWWSVLWELFSEILTPFGRPFQVFFDRLRRMWLYPIGAGAFLGPTRGIFHPVYTLYFPSLEVGLLLR